MLRVILYLLLAVLLITLLRSFLGVILKAAGKWLLADGGARPTETGGELIKDPVCGVYISAAASFKLNQAGKTLHFCSEACREKYRRAERAGSSRS